MGRVVSIEKERERGRKQRDTDRRTDRQSNIYRQKQTDRYKEIGTMREKGEITQ